MRISEQWLRDWVQPDVSSAQLAEQLTMAGLEVDKIETAAPPFNKVVVGRIRNLSPHPQADRLKVAQVDVGGSELLQIVCGAPNAAVDMCAPTALPGAELPGGVQVESTELRGVASQGMLCSARELGLSEDHSGLLALPADSPAGIDLRTHLGLDDTIIEVDLTPNRGDCLGMAGIAREVSVLNRCPLTPPAIDSVPPALDDTFKVKLSAAAACPRFIGRVIRGIDPTARSPLWLTERLRRAGLRSLGPVVDITNYVMLELNHPMHAYDLNKLQGSIEVRWSRAGEHVQLLNEQTVTLDDDTLLITDGSGPIGLAGIMGGATTEVGSDTHDVFFECAFFTPIKIAGRARRYGLHTDASQRFERGVDPHGQMHAVERATQLLLDIAGGQPGPLIDTHIREHLPSPPTVTLRAQRLERVLGMPVPTAEVEDILTRLGMSVQATEDGWQATAPSKRFDIEREEDLIEEIGRIRGYNQLPRSASHSRLPLADCPEDHIPTARLREVLVQRDYLEAITYSFVDPQLQQLFDPEQQPIPLSNPISAEMAVMRTSLWPGLVKTLRYNQARQQQRVRLFETGLTFKGRSAAIEQEPYLSGLICGNVLAEQWGSPRRSVDFFDLKSDVEALLALSGRAYRYRPAPHPALHPGQSALIEHGDQHVGWLGALHPSLQNQLELEQPAYVFELNLAALQSAIVPQAHELSKFPQSRRDLSIVVATDISAQAVADALHQHGGTRLRRVELFDVYQGKGIDEDQRSLAFSLIFQDFSSSLTDQEIDQTIAKIIAGIQQDLGANLRD